MVTFKDLRNLNLLECGYDYINCYVGTKEKTLSLLDNKTYIVQEEREREGWSVEGEGIQIGKMRERD